MNLNEAIAKYYLLADLCYRADSYYRPEFEKYSEWLAEKMASYIDMVIGGEIRYGSHHLTEQTDYLPRIKERVGRKLNRGTAWAAWKQLRDEYGIDILIEAEEALLKAKWGAGIGGKMWGKVATHLRLFLTGEYPAWLFVDIAVDLEHNGGNIFNKVFDTHKLKKLLDAKFEGRIIPDESVYGEWRTRHRRQKKTYTWVGDFISEEQLDSYLTAKGFAEKKSVELQREQAYLLGKPPGKAVIPQSIKDKVDAEMKELRNRFLNTKNEDNNGN